TMLALEEEGKEATPQRLEEIIDFAKENDIRVIFYQEEMASRQAAAFAEEIGGKAVMLSPLAADYTDNLASMADALAEALK
ncbi:MAG TPA: zinc ABC transporter substrate-binding protein, partial [Clostridia bacterium]|nr:zinc ABC transporter substrate-binding protein [Clostridia bacterium]